MSEVPDLPLIVTCGCGDTDAFVAVAWKLLFKDKPLPPIRHDSADSSNPQIRALAKSQEKYAYYFGSDGTWDLIKGVRVG